MNESGNKEHVPWVILKEPFQMGTTLPYKRGPLMRLSKVAGLHKLGCDPCTPFPESARLGPKSLMRRYSNPVLLARYTQDRSHMHCNVPFFHSLGGHQALARGRAAFVGGLVHKGIKACQHLHPLQLPSHFQVRLDMPGSSTNR